MSVPTCVSSPPAAVQAGKKKASKIGFSGFSYTVFSNMGIGKDASIPLQLPICSQD